MQLLQIDCASVGSSDTVSSLLLMLSTPSEEVSSETCSTTADLKELAHVCQGLVDKVAGT